MLGFASASVERAEPPAPDFILKEDNQVSWLEVTRYIADERLKARLHNSKKLVEEAYSKTKEMDAFRGVVVELELEAADLRSNGRSRLIETVIAWVVERFPILEECNGRVLGNPIEVRPCPKQGNHVACWETNYNGGWIGISADVLLEAIRKKDRKQYATNPLGPIVLLIHPWHDIVQSVGDLRHLTDGDIAEIGLLVGRSQFEDLVLVNDDGQSMIFRSDGSYSRQTFQVPSISEVYGC